MHWIDPACLPETKGIVDRFLLNSHGVADGMLLKDRKEVYFAPHMAGAVVAAFKLGDLIKVRGVRPRGVDMIVAISLQADGAIAIVDDGPEGNREPTRKHEEHKHSKIEGLVARVLHGPKGEERGVLLDNGTIVRMPPHTAASLHGGLTSGQELAARGPSMTSELGTVIDAHEIGASLSALHPVGSKKHDEKAERKSVKREEKVKKQEPAG